MRAFALFLAVTGLPSAVWAQTPAQWLSPFLEIPFDGSCSAGGSSVGGSGGDIGLFIDKTRPDVLAVTFTVNDDLKTDMAATPMTASLFFSTGTMTLPGHAKRDEGLPLQFSVNVTGEKLRQLVHLLTADPGPLTATFTQDPGVARIPLAGSSKAVDAMQRCVLSHRFTGVVAPFRGQPGAPATPRQCLAFGDRATLRGILISKTMDIEEEPREYPELRLDQPVCVDRADAISPFQPAVRVMLLEALPGMDFSPPPRAFNKPIEITGTLREPVSKFDFEATILTLSKP